MVQRVQNKLKSYLKNSKAKETAEKLKKVEQQQLKEIQEKLKLEPDTEKKLKIWDDYINAKEAEKERLADLMGYGPEYQHSMVTLL